MLSSLIALLLLRALHAADNGDDEEQRLQISSSGMFRRRILYAVFAAWLGLAQRVEKELRSLSNMMKVTLDYPSFGEDLDLLGMRAGEPPRPPPPPLTLPDTWGRGFSGLGLGFRV